MAYGQVDPASLEGDALMRWYRRTPQEIEEERRRAAADAYNRFFYPTRASNADVDLNDQVSQSDDGQDPRTSSDRQASSWPQPGAPPFGNSVADGRVQLAAAPNPGFWDYWGVPGCANCHGYKPNTLPPYGGHFPFPSNVMPRSGNPGGGSSGPTDSGRSGRNPPQCVIQYENDSEICRSLPAWDARKRCWASAANREGYCNKTKGEVGYPPLITR